MIDHFGRDVVAACTPRQDNAEEAVAGSSTGSTTAPLPRSSGATIAVCITVDRAALAAISAEPQLSWTPTSTHRPRW